MNSGFFVVNEINVVFTDVIFVSTRLSASLDDAVFIAIRRSNSSDDIIAVCHQCGESADVHTNCANEACHLLFIQCDTCKNKMENCCSDECQTTIHLPFEEQKILRKGFENSNKILEIKDNVVNLSPEFYQEEIIKKWIQLFN